MDNTNFLVWTESFATSNEELIKQARYSVTDRSLLVQASGGILKSTKHSLYLLSYRFMRGEACLKCPKDLSHAPAEVETKDDNLLPVHATIPQPNRTTHHI